MGNRGHSHRPPHRPGGHREISLVVAVASPHRKEAFYACHRTVDRIKETVPIWKKEFFEDGYHWVACEDHEHTLVQGASS